ncbi:hypothetical protein [Novipirellula artificiosorum]|uniref:Uncharacterized protein n=1 Tax=Novipirellula artificiosorum TaxID=2528016 RepID=A0A5C6C9Q9_9BACT|nr:hypothetical protein [Novipirellula artificiosorum]TWU21330.1 hypothetical protein Poly41_71590 [Novipirellula artificiosorum]
MTTPNTIESPISEPIDQHYRYLHDVDAAIQTLEQLQQAYPEQYESYCRWYHDRECSRRVRDERQPLENRIGAYLQVVARYGRGFIPGRDSTPSQQWLRESLGIHRNTLLKWTSTAAAIGYADIHLVAAGQLAFAAAIFPAATQREKTMSHDVQRERLDLIQDYRFFGGSIIKMLDRLIPIVHTGVNDLFTRAKRYPYAYNLNADGTPVRLAQDHVPRGDGDDFEEGYGPDWLAGPTGQPHSADAV